MVYFMVFVGAKITVFISEHLSLIHCLISFCCAMLIPYQLIVSGVGWQFSLSAVSPRIPFTLHRTAKSKLSRHSADVKLEQT